MDVDALLRQAEEDIEAAWCALDAAHARLLAEATDLVAGARVEAAAAVAAAHQEAQRILAEADATAGEHTDVIRALTEAEREAAGEELAGLRDAVNRLRTELSRVVDAAFDAFPAIEATTETIDQLLEPRRGLFRRLLRRH